MNRAFLRRRAQHQVVMAKLRKRDREASRSGAAKASPQQSEPHEPRGDDLAVLDALLGRPTRTAEGAGT